MDRETRGLDHGQPVWVVSRITQLPVTKRRPHPHLGPSMSYGPAGRRRRLPAAGALARPVRPARRQARGCVKNKLAQASADWRSGGCFPYQSPPWAAPGSGQPRPLRRLGRAGWPYRACFFVTQARVSRRGQSASRMIRSGACAFSCSWASLAVPPARDGARCR